ncbi:MAG: DUF1501 domain-containing protein [Burkholderiales bacterium]|nr:DUF1501 domain-containing protein [Burkholderiales bacterium]MBZ0248087.1 DUF1501 domain-containing protein [Burkholderiales bacterium]MCL4688336.1 DUF1501 domain-containing protein [Burkholderiales bacterium]
MNRRRFLQSLSAFGAAPFLPGFAAPAVAADVAGYKALVCVFLFGGNDSHNTVVPFTTAEYNAYSTARGGPAEANGLALPQGALLPLSGTGFGFHPALPKLASLFNADHRLAIVGNTGILLAPTTLAQYRNKSVPLPPQLFSHSDMQSHWQTMRSDHPAATGWGGRLADVLGPAVTGLLPVSVSLGGGGVFLKGQTLSAYQVTKMRYRSGAIDPGSRIARVPRADVYWNWTGSDPQALFVGNTRRARANLLEEQYAGVMEGALDIGQFVMDSMYDTATINGATTYALRHPVPGIWPTDNPLASQLHSVAAMIAARQALGVTRQIFFVSLGGFDNHGDQFARDEVTGNKTLLAGVHFKLLRYLDEALKTFYDTTVAMGVASGVTTMTMSDFGRTLKSNGQGSDHGWGGHQLVLGGAVNGGRIVGEIPPVTLGTSFDVGEGRLLPTIASDTYAATFARWLGATNGELDAVLPNLARFPARTLDLFA